MCTETRAFAVGRRFLRRTGHFLRGKPNGVRQSDGMRDRILIQRRRLTAKLRNRDHGIAHRSANRPGLTVPTKDSP